jgi:hypothetical protein
LRETENYYLQRRPFGRKLVGGASLSSDRDHRIGEEDRLGVTVFEASGFGSVARVLRRAYEIRELWGGTAARFVISSVARRIFVRSDSMLL